MLPSEDRILACMARHHNAATNETERQASQWRSLSCGVLFRAIELSVLETRVKLKRQIPVLVDPFINNKDEHELHRLQETGAQQ